MSNDSQSSGKGFQGWVYSLLVVLSVGGIAIMDFSVKYGFWYWLAMAVVFGAVSIALAWKRDRDMPGDQSTRIRKQALHWGTLILALLLAFLMPHGELMEASTQGLTALLLVAVTALLAGIHFDWRMAVVGLILAATFVAAVLAEEFFWPLLIVAFLAVVIIWGFRRKPAAE